MSELTNGRKKAYVLIVPSSCLSPTDSRNIHSNSSKYEFMNVNVAQLKWKVPSFVMQYILLFILE